LTLTRQLQRFWVNTSS